MNLDIRLKWGLMTLISLLFCAGGVWLLIEEPNNTWKALVMLVPSAFSLLVSITVLVKTFNGSKTVEFTDENLVIIGLFGKKTPIPWNKIKGFGIWKTSNQHQIKVFTLDIEKEIAEMPTAFRRHVAQFNYDFSGAIYFIPEDMSGMSMTELLEKCNQELKKHQKSKAN